MPRSSEDWFALYRAVLGIAVGAAFVLWFDLGWDYVIISLVCAIVCVVVATVKMSGEDL